MKQMNYKEAIEMLRRAGFSMPEIGRLMRLRHSYTTNAMDQAPGELRRLEFVRWLVATRRLTDQIV